ncbi:MAG TPA: competence protein, partial [Cyanobacteria bacterium UBA11372]|nr:competence protein [Cyanobacteria bacterium UBA11372]
VWLWHWWQRRWWLAGLIAISLVVFPVWYAKTTLFQVTVLATPGEPVLIIQDQGKITLVNSGDANTARFTVLPFLQQQGVNQIDAAIRCCTPRLAKGTDTQVTNNGWSTILERLPITNFYNEPAIGDSTSQPNFEFAVQSRKGTYQTLAAGRSVETGSTDVKLLDADLPVLQLQIQGQNWLLLGNLQPDQQKQLATKIGLSNLQVLAWSGERLTDDLLKVLKPSVAIASSSSVDPDTVTALRRNKTQLFWTNRDGAIQWSPKGGFEATLELTENEASLL